MVMQFQSNVVQNYLLPTEKKTAIAVNRLHDNISVKKETNSKRAPELSMGVNNNFRYAINHELNRVFVQIVNKHTDEVIMEIPAEIIQKLHSYYREKILDMYV